VQPLKFVPLSRRTVVILANWSILQLVRLRFNKDRRDGIAGSRPDWRIENRNIRGVK
jgi:hypothetical protein